MLPAIGIIAVPVLVGGMVGLVTQKKAVGRSPCGKTKEDAVGLAYIPGAGHIYAGRYQKGAFMLSAFVVLIIYIVYTFLSSPDE
ncbi:MAG: hypothetical protein LBU30_00180, partial [Candidatus Methanoplasma sp.]|nr:hypothetical protein [Candidatus Methanoplasma sp.]